MCRITRNAAQLSDQRAWPVVRESRRQRTPLRGESRARGREATGHERALGTAKTRGGARRTTLPGDPGPRRQSSNGRYWRESSSIRSAEWRPAPFARQSRASAAPQGSQRPHRCRSPRARRPYPRTKKEDRIEARTLRQFADARIHALDYHGHCRIDGCGFRTNPVRDRLWIDGALNDYVRGPEVAVSLILPGKVKLGTRGRSEAIVLHVAGNADDGPPGAL